MAFACYNEPTVSVTSGGEQSLLITPFSPEAGFNAGNAMQRNKYIYCLSDASVVVHSGNPETSKNGKGGGTWTGAMENLTWVPLWVKPSSDTKSGMRPS